MGKIFKKTLSITLIAIITLIWGGLASASSPAELSVSVSSNYIGLGEELVISTYVIHGNVVECLLEGVSNCQSSGIHYDSDVFEFISFTSDYISYNGQTQLVDSLGLEASNYSQGVVLPFYANRDEPPVLLWELKLKVKDKAVVDETVVYNQNINILPVSDPQESGQVNLKSTESKDYIKYIIIGLVGLGVILAIILFSRKK